RGSISATSRWLANTNTASCPITGSCGENCGRSFDSTEPRRQNSSTKFMKSEHLQNLDVSWGHEPGIPLTRPSATLSPIGGEGWGEGVRFMGGLLLALLVVAITAPPAARAGT